MTDVLCRPQNQLKLDNFFQVQFEEARKIQSKRIRRVVNRFSHPSTDQDGVECNEGESLEENSVRGKRKGKRARRTSPTSNKQEETFSTEGNKERKVGKTTSSSLEEEKSNVSTPGGSVEEETVETTSVLQNKGEKVAARESERGSGRAGSIPQDTQTNPEQRLDHGGTSEDDNMTHDKEKEKKGSRKQKRNTERLDVGMEQGPSKRTRSGISSRSESGSKRNTAFAKWSDETLTPTSDYGITRRSTSPQSVAPTTGCSSNRTPDQTRGRCRGATRGQAKKRLRTPLGTTEGDSTSSDSEGSDDNCYTGPQPECVRKGESVPRGRRSAKRRGRGRGNGRGTKRTTCVAALV